MELHLLMAVEPGSRRSLGGAALMPSVEPGSRRSSGGAALQTKLRVKFGSDRSPD